MCRHNWLCTFTKVHWYFILENVNFIYFIFIIIKLLDLIVKSVLLSCLFHQICSLFFNSLSKFPYISKFTIWVADFNKGWVNRLRPMDRTAGSVAYTGHRPNILKNPRLCRILGPSRIICGLCEFGPRGPWVSPQTHNH